MNRRDALLALSALPLLRLPAPKDDPNSDWIPVNAQGRRFVVGMDWADKEDATVVLLFEDGTLLRSEIREPS